MVIELAWRTNNNLAISHSIKMFGPAAGVGMAPEQLCGAGCSAKCINRNQICSELQNLLLVHTDSAWPRQ
jgi:hypothetical protein